MIRRAPRLSKVKKYMIKRKMKRCQKTGR